MLRKIISIKQLYLTFSQIIFNRPSHLSGINLVSWYSSDNNKTKTEIPISPRVQELKKKLREKTPIGKLDEIDGPHPYAERNPLKPFPNNTNPMTGEVGGPRGLEPTRYGDWERKGRVSDF